MKNELSKKKLKKMISSDFTDLSEEEIKALIQKEVSKGADNLDTDYIDLCFQLLEVKNNKENTKRTKFTKPTKALLIAAALMVVFVSTVSVFAQINLNIPQKIAQLIDGNAEIVDYNLENADTTADGYALLDTDLAKQLADYGITPVTFPEEMIKENCKITQIENASSDEVSNIVDIYFEYDGYKGDLYIKQMSENSESTGVWGVNNIESGQMIKVNGLNILIFEKENSCTIIYKNNSTTYNIILYCDLNTAIEFAESIK